MIFERVNNSKIIDFNLAQTSKNKTINVIKIS